MQIAGLRKYLIQGLAENNAVYDIDIIQARTEKQAIDDCERKNKGLLGGLRLKAKEIRWE